MPQMIALMGAPGSGKSTWIDQNNNGATWLVLDDYYQRDETGRRFWLDDQENKVYWGEPKFTSKQFIDGLVFLWGKYLEVLKSQQDVIVESIFHSYESRLPVAQAAKSFGYQTKIIWIHLPLLVVLARNSSRVDYVPEDNIAKYYLATEPPIEAEGWDIIEKIKGV